MIRLLTNKRGAGEMFLVLIFSATLIVLLVPILLEYGTEEWLPTGKSKPSVVQLTKQN